VVTLNIGAVPGSQSGQPYNITKSAYKYIVADAGDNVAGNYSSNREAANAHIDNYRIATGRRT
jgi:hypothetical protein